MQNPALPIAFKGIQSYWFVPAQGINGTLNDVLTIPIEICFMLFLLSIITTMVTAITDIQFTFCDTSSVSVLISNTIKRSVRYHVLTFLL